MTVKDILLSDIFTNFSFPKFCVTLNKDLYVPAVKKIIKIIDEKDSITNELILVKKLCLCVEYINDSNLKNKALVYAKIHNTLVDYKLKKKLFVATKWDKLIQNLYLDLKYIRDITMYLSYLYGVKNNTRYIPYNKKQMLDLCKSDDILILGLKSLIKTDSKLLRYSSVESIENYFGFF